MSHSNAPLTPTGRLRMVAHHLDDGEPKSHVAAEFRVSRPTVTTWVARYIEDGEEGLADRSSTPVGSPSQTAPEIVERIDTLRRRRKQSARRIWHHLLAGGCDSEKGRGHWHGPVVVSLRTVGRWLHRLGISDAARPRPRRADQRRRAYTPRHNGNPNCNCPALSCPVLCIVVLVRGRVTVCPLGL